MSSIIKLSLPLLCVLMLAGCASGPRYTYTQDADSAELNGHGNASTNLEILAVSIAQIDGAFLRKSIFANSKPVYAAPGTHSIGLRLRYYEDALIATIPMDLKPAHRYFFTMIPRSKDFEVVVYDETNSPAEVVLRALVPRGRKGGIIYLPNKKPDRQSD